MVHNGNKNSKKLKATPARDLKKVKYPREADIDQDWEYMSVFDLKKMEFMNERKKLYPVHPDEGIGQSPVVSG